MARNILFWQSILRHLRIWSTIHSFISMTDHIERRAWFHVNKLKVDWEFKAFLASASTVQLKWLLKRLTLQSVCMVFLCLNSKPFQKSSFGKYWRYCVMIKRNYVLSFSQQNTFNFSSLTYLIFIGPESDHWLCLSLTHWLTDSLTPWRLVNLMALNLNDANCLVMS